MNLSHEKRLLLSCLRYSTNDYRTENNVGNLITPFLNWGDVLESSSWHGITPLLYKQLKGVERSHSIPQEVMNKLKEAYQWNLARNTYIYVILKTILEAFREKDVEVIVLKGGVLAQVVYGDIALRRMGDIDILVKKENLARSEAIMSELGYTFKGEHSPDWYRENMYHIKYIDPVGAIPIEVHWHIGSPQFDPLGIFNFDILDIKDWWERAVFVDLCGMEVLSLCPEDLLIYLSLHFFRHRYAGKLINKDRGFCNRGSLLQLCDLIFTLHYYSEDVNVKKLEQRAQQYGVERLVHCTFSLIRELTNDYSSFLPHAFNGLKHDDLDRKFLALFKKRILFSEDTPPIPYGFFRSLGNIKFYHELIAALKRIFPHQKELSEQYSVPLSSKRLYFYYAVHLIKLLLKYKNSLSSPTLLKEEALLHRWINMRSS